MKKIFITLIISIIAMPAFAACSVTGGACSFGTPSLENTLIPQNLQNLERNSTFQENIKSYDVNKIDSDYSDTSSSKPQANDYNADCQFGVCLPGGNSLR